MVARYLVPVILVVGLIIGGTYMFLSGGVSGLKEKVQALEAEGLTVETSSWAVFLVEHPPSTKSSHWVGARAYRYEYQSTTGRSSRTWRRAPTASGSSFTARGTSWSTTTRRPGSSGT
jgi:hypothetical protein